MSMHNPAHPGEMKIGTQGEDFNSGVAVTVWADSNA